VLRLDERGSGKLAADMAGPGLLIAVVLVVIGAFLAYWGVGTVDNIWGYQDSPDWVYLMYGVPLLLAGVLCLAGAAKIIRRR
jgi:hypothetical protein